MIRQAAIVRTDLYELDETAWLEAMASLIEQGRSEDLDFLHLREYLTDMAKRDRREVESRLVVLLAHLLKWSHQPDHRSRSWRGTIIEQRQELNRLAKQGVLRQHAEAVLADMYVEAVDRAIAETGLARDVLPRQCPYTIEALFSTELAEE